MDLKPFDPADYLDSEEGFQAYLADARLDGPASLSRAVAVVARARARMAQSASAPGKSSPNQKQRQAS